MRRILNGEIDINPGPVVQWIEFQVSALTIEVRILAGSYAKLKIQRGFAKFKLVLL